MPYNEQPPLDSDYLRLVQQGTSRGPTELGYFAFDVSSGTISNAGTPSSTTLVGDSVSPTSSGTAQTTTLTDGVGASFFGDTNEGTL